jgi:surface antigen
LPQWQCGSRNDLRRNRRGLIGSAASHGNGGAVLGGLFGNALGSDVDCDDQPYAFSEFSVGLNGDIGRRYEWSHGEARGYFVPTREFRRGGIVCRDFTETSYRAGRPMAIGVSTEVLALNRTLVLVNRKGP